MKRYLKKSAAAAFFIAVIMISGTLVNAAANLPEYVRIGLYFNDAKIHMKTAVSSFNASADKGLQLGFYANNKFYPLAEEASSNPVTIRKDSYFIKNADSFWEYTPGSGDVPAGEKIGPFHIKIGNDFPDFNSLNTQIKLIRQKGIDAYPAYVGSWQIWTGFYLDENSAQKYIETDIKNVLGSGEYTIVQPSSGRVAALRNDNSVIFVFESEGAFLQVRPKDENKPDILSLDGVLYRGFMEVRRIDGSDMTVINVLPIEEYLYGVVPYEIGAGAHIEALKAQAVSARTYTLNNLGKFKRYGFDLCPTTTCQVYKGYAGEAASTNKAVEDTKGKIVTYNGRPAQVFYFSSSGGRTEDVKNVWGSDIPYLKSVEDKYESGKSRYYNWESVYTPDEIKRVLAGLKYDVGDILSINITKLSEAGRVTELVVKGTKGECTFVNEACRYRFSLLRSQWYNIATDADVTVAVSGANEGKMPMGGMKVMTSNGISTLNSSQTQITVQGSGGKKYTVSAIPTKYIFTGRGWGHAVGMSQEGAKGMALAGFKYDEILMHYFTGTKVE